MFYRQRSEKSLELRDLLKKKGYPAEFCDAISFELNTDYTAARMIGYIKAEPFTSMEIVADEMLAILSDRETYVKKKEAEYAQSKINEMYMYGLGISSDEDE